MRPILAIAAITIRTAIRSKIVISLLAILLALIVGLPLTVKSDGTLAGQVEIIIGYTLGIAGTLLSMATLWAGCAAVSSEIQEKQIQMLVAKPVHRAQVWLGKWAGLMAMNSLLLLVCVAATYGLLRWSLRPSQLSDADRGRLENEIFVARREIRPPLPDVEARARAQFVDMMKKGQISKNADPDDALEAIRRNFRAVDGAVPPGNGRSWPIDLPERVADDAELTVRFKFAMSSVERNPIACVWFAGTPENSRLFRVSQTNVPLAFHEFQIPARVLHGGTALMLSYANTDDSGVTVMFGNDDSLAVLVPVGGFAANMARGALIVLAQLAFLSALGVTAGTIFSLPVAGFTSLFMVLLLFSGGMVGELSATKYIVGDARSTSVWEAAANTTLRSMYRALNAVVSPMDFDMPWDEVATARMVSWTRVEKAMLVNVLIYGGLVALFGAYVFNRREVALPQN